MSIEMKSKGHSRWIRVVIGFAAIGCFLFLGACSSPNKQAVCSQEGSNERAVDTVPRIESISENADMDEGIEGVGIEIHNGFKQYERKREFTKMEAYIGLTLPMEHERWMAHCLAEFLWLETMGEEQGQPRPNISSYSSLMDYYLTLQVGTEGPEVDEDRMHQTYIDADSLNVVPTWQSVDKSYTTYRINTFFYHGGAHPLYKDFYLTFDNKKQCMLSRKDIFKVDSMDEVIRRLKMKAGDRSVFCYEEIEDDEDAMEPMPPRWEHYQTHYIPRPALTAQGVIFSYQRYEIDSYAAGELHFILPYEEIKDLLNPIITNTLKL